MAAGCLETSAWLQQSMNITADPCDDFYQYVCGNYSNNIDVTAMSYSSSLHANYEISVDHLYSSLEVLLSADDATTIYQQQTTNADLIEKAKNVYKACMNQPSIEKAGVQPAFDYLSTVHPWPVIQPDLFNEATYDYIESAGKYISSWQAYFILRSYRRNVSPAWRRSFSALPYRLCRCGNSVSYMPSRQQKQCEICLL